ncbi:hypothetical protein [Wenxinia saemankumensis]|uniref:Uncharacterized protein n=1 Tax=Wenxinia saemankumensis TaxID=1447782 RepID=A0A1M6H2F6_9RHOB|nr:hypothetical protein [Wenxinia saemankumensis]SHJ16332.1 hypothetical protein SAMN05444417_3067 [Wenxinia saemankumensis]
MKVAHVICRREGTSLKHLASVGGGKWTSGFWKLPTEEAEALIGGRIFLHETKIAPSAFGGEVLSWERIAKGEHAGRVVFTLRPTLADKGVGWRGQDHAMAWYGGLVEVDAE